MGSTPRSDDGAVLPNSPDLRRRWGILVCLLAVLASLLLVHPEIALQGKIYASSDAESAEAFQTIGRESLEAGEYPHWNPFVFLGMPSYASLAFNPGVYPLTEPVRWVRDTLGLPPMTWLLFHLFLAGLSTSAYLRWRGCSWATAAFGGALIIALPKFIAWSAYGHGTKLGTFAWLPLALWCTEALLRGGGRGWAAALALVLSLQLLRGHVQIAYYTVLAMGVYVLFDLIASVRSGGSWRESLRPVGWIALAGVLALGVSASLYLPVFEYQSWSIRGAGGGGGGGGSAYDYATSWSMLWTEISTFWWPTAVGYGRAAYVGGMPFTDYPHYVGLPLLLLGLWSVVRRRDRWNGALLFLVIVSTLVALGNHGPLYRLFYELLPGFQKFRVPVMILCLHHFALILLAAGGLEDLLDRLREGERPRWMGRPLLGAGLLLGLVLVFLGSVGGSTFASSLVQQWQGMAAAAGRASPPSDALAEAADLAVSDALRLGAILLALSLILAAWARGRIPRAAVVGLAGLLLLIDLWRVDQPLLHPEDHLSQIARQGSRLVSVPSAEVIRSLEGLEDAPDAEALARWLHQREERPRVWPLGSQRSQDNVLAAEHLVSLGGYHAAKLKVYQDLREELFAQRPSTRLANLLAARWVLVPQVLSDRTLGALEEMGLRLSPEPPYQGTEGVLYENLTVGPRAWMVHEYRLESPGGSTTGSLPDESVLRRLLAPGFDPARSVILSEEPTIAPRPAGAPPEIDVRDPSHHRVVVEVDTEAPGILVLADVWYPEWGVWVDGERHSLLRADHALRAVALESGEHVVEFRYEASAHRRGIWIRNASLLLIAVGIVLPIVWRRRRRALEPEAER